MGKILFIKKKIGKSCIVWFENSNLFFYLEEPAWFVFKNIVKRYKSETIAKEFSNRYGLSYEDSLNFVVEIRQKANEINQSNNYKKFIEKFGDKINKHVYSNYSSHCYNLQNKTIKFSYETYRLERYIHPLIKHLETTEDLKSNSHFKLFTYKNRVIFKVDNILKGSWTKDESEFVKGSVFVELLNTLHNKTETDWLMTVHASAISNGRKTILFSAASHSGKTTFAALLQAQGYHIISDDFVTIEQSSFKAYPLPIAMMVREGAVELLTSHYPELDNISITKKSKKKIKYLPVANEIMNMIFPVNDFVFLKYDTSVDFSFEKMEPVEGIKQLFEDAWVPPAPENVAIFLDRILNTSFYNLTYSNNKKAIDAINQLFKNK